MFVKMPRAMLMASLLSSVLLWPCSSWGLGLGEIHLNSALNEPMNAEIDLIAAAPDELTALRASLASRESFTRYGIDKPPFLSTMTFKVGKSKDGRDVLLVRSTDAIPEPFVTFLVEVNWARGRLMREYTVLLDPPVYTPGETPNSAPAVAGATTGAASTAPGAAAPGSPSEPLAPGPTTTTTPTPAAPAAARSRGRRGTSSGARASNPAPAPAEETPSPASTPSAPVASDATTVQVGKGDTLTKIARGLDGGDAPKGNIDQTMIALYRANPAAFGGNINVLRQGAVLRVPGADQVAALNQKEAMSEVHRQIEAWRDSEGASAVAGGHLRLVTPSSGGSTGGTGTSAATSSGETQALKDRVKDLEAQLAESKRLIDIRSSELAALQHKLGVPATPTAPAPAAIPPAPVPVTKPAPAVTPAPSAAIPPAATPPAATPPVTSVPVSAAQPQALPPEVVNPPPVATPKPKPVAPKPVVPADSGSWIDWVADNWWVPLALLVLVLGGLGFAAMRRRRKADSGAPGALLDDPDAPDPFDPRDPTSKLSALRRGDQSFVVEESGPHPLPEFGADTHRFGDTGELKSTEDTMSSESAVNLDQGDPLAEADFHMAYGLYDQAADLVRIALEREPDRRDLRLKLLEIYFVWGNKDAFLQTAKGLEATRDRAPAGEWDKILIMGKQICPDEPMFSASAGSGRGAGALVDLNLEGGENRVDIDLFGDPEGERSTLDHLAKEADDTSATGESPAMHARSDLDFTLDAPERGADSSPTHEMAPRDEPTVESELMNFGDANFLDTPDDGSGVPTTVESPTRVSPVLNGAHARDAAGRSPKSADQTAEVSVDDLGLDLDNSVSHLEATDHPADAPTMVAGLDERSRRMMQEAERNARDRDLTELERELEASFVADLAAHQDEIKTAVLGPESAPTVLMPRETDPGHSQRLNGADSDLDSTSKLRELHADSIDLDLDRLATALGNGGDTLEQPRAAEDLFSSEVFEASQRSKRVDLDVGEPLNGADAPTNKLRAQTNRLKPVDLPIPELEPVTMSEVGTKLDLARAYMDMGDPEGARSILEEVVQEGSSSQKQEASRLIESLPG
jgi:pilus assembly protein FimV